MARRKAARSAEKRVRTERRASPRPSKAVRRAAAPAPLSPEATNILIEQVRERVDHFHLRIDTLCGRLDALSSRQDTRDRIDDLRLAALEAQMQELPAIIERSLRAVLREESGED